MRLEGVHLKAVLKRVKSRPQKGSSSVTDPEMLKSGELFRRRSVKFQPKAKLSYAGGRMFFQG